MGSVGERKLKSPFTHVGSAPALSFFKYHYIMLFPKGKNKVSRSGKNSRIFWGDKKNKKKYGPPYIKYCNNKNNMFGRK